MATTTAYEMYERSEKPNSPTLNSRLFYLICNLSFPQNKSKSLRTQLNELNLLTSKNSYIFIGPVICLHTDFGFMFFHIQSLKGRGSTLPQNEQKCVFLIPQNTLRFKNSKEINR